MANKVENVKNTNKRPAILRIIFDFISTNKILFTCAIICILLTSVGNIAAPLTLQIIVNRLSEWIKGGALGDKAQLISDTTTNVLILVGCYCVSVLAGLAYSQIMAIIGQGYMNTLRKKIFSHMEDLPVKYFDINDKGDIMSVYLNDVDTVRQLLINSIPEILICTCTFLTAFFIMLFSSVWLTLFVIASAVVMILLVDILVDIQVETSLLNKMLSVKKKGTLKK